MIEIEDALAFLPRELDPPGPLEDAIVAALRHEGKILPAGEMRTIASRSRISLGNAILVGLAAAVVAFFGGLRVGTPRSNSRDTLPRFALLLYEGKSFDHGRPDEHRQEYSRWARSLAKRAIPVEGDELSTDYRVLRASGGTIREESPAPADETLAGYFIVGASNLDRAIEIARECPHLKYHGRVEVRAIPSR